MRSARRSSPGLRSQRRHPIMLTTEPCSADAALAVKELGAYYKQAFTKLAPIIKNYTKAPEDQLDAIPCIEACRMTGRAGAHLLRAGVVRRVCASAAAVPDHSSRTVRRRCARRGCNSAVVRPPRAHNRTDVCAGTTDTAQPPRRPQSSTPRFARPDPTRAALTAAGAAAHHVAADGQRGRRRL